MARLMLMAKVPQLVRGMVKAKGDYATASDL